MIRGSDGYKDFQKFLREERLRKDITQVELANRLGSEVRQNFVSKYENGERRLDVAEYILVARALKISPEGLLKKYLRSKS